jgi:hypothetical protein
MKSRKRRLWFANFARQVRLCPLYEFQFETGLSFTHAMLYKTTSRDRRTEKLQIVFQYASQEMKGVHANRTEELLQIPSQSYLSHLP